MHIDTGNPLAEMTKICVICWGFFSFVIFFFFEVVVYVLLFMCFIC